MMIKEEGGSVYEEVTQKKKKVKSTGSQTVIRFEDDHQSDTQAKAKGKKKKCLAEEDSDQLNLSKKKKVGSKLKKKAYSDNPVNIRSSSDSESIKEIKEKSKVLKKKSKKGQGLPLLTLENNQDSDQDLPKKHKTNSQEKIVIDVKHRDNVAQNSEGDIAVSKRKKKKKERHVSSLALVEIQGSDHEVSNKNLKKQNKTTLQENALAAKKHRKNIVQNSDIMMKKKKKKKDKHDSLSLADNQDSNHRVSDENVSTRDFRKYQETNSQENTFLNKKQKENIVQNSESDKELTKKKKKKSKDVSSLICEDNQDQSHRVSNKHLPRKKEARSQEKALAGEKHRENSEDDSEVTKKKKKSIQKEEEEVTGSINLVDEGAEVSEGEKITPVKSNRKNRKRKSKPMEDLTVDNVDEGLHENNNVHCDNKGKKRNKQGSQNSAEEPRLKKKKKVTVKIEKTKNEAMECKDDVTVVEERKGNCDEINIDKVRRQALQEEIDRESGKTKDFGNKVESQDTKFGQWSTATFESSDRKTKFLKLMGGFKKGSASTQDLPATTEKPNMALNRKGEETLKQTLQTEFEKAINLKQHRGIGLGFQPIASKKKVHIDIYASRSVKFDD